MAGFPPLHPTSDSDYMGRLDRVTQDDVWQKKIYNGIRDCREALPPPPPSDDYMGRMNHVLMQDRCQKFVNNFFKK